MAVEMEPGWGLGEPREMVMGSAMDLVSVTDSVWAMGLVKDEPSEMESGVLSVSALDEPLASDVPKVLALAPDLDEELVLAMDAELVSELVPGPDAMVLVEPVLVLE